MALPFRKLHPLFAAEAGPVDLRQVHDRETLERIRAGMELILREPLASLARQAGRTAVAGRCGGRQPLPDLIGFERLVREIKGNSSFRPADLFPDVVIDTASFASDPPCCMDTLSR